MQLNTSALSLNAENEQILSDLPWDQNRVLNQIHEVKEIKVESEPDTTNSHGESLLKVNEESIIDLDKEGEHNINMIATQQTIVSNDLKSIPQPTFEWCKLRETLKNMNELEYANYLMTQKFFDECPTWYKGNVKGRNQHFKEVEIEELIKTIILDHLKPKIEHILNEYSTKRIDAMMTGIMRALMRLPMHFLKKTTTANMYKNTSLRKYLKALARTYFTTFVPFFNISDSSDIETFLDFIAINSPRRIELFEKFYNNGAQTSDVSKILWLLIKLFSQQFIPKSMNVF